MRLRADVEVWNLIVDAEGVKDAKCVGRDVSDLGRGLAGAIGKVRNVVLLRNGERASEEPTAGRVVELNVRSGGNRADVIEIAIAFRDGRNGLIVRSRFALVAPFFGEEEEGLVLFRVEEAGDI